MKSDSQPKTVKQTLYIMQNVCPDSWDELYRIACYDLSTSSYDGYKYVCLGKHDIELDIPTDVNPAALAIANLEKHRDEVRAEMMQKISAIDERIESIRCIEYKPEGGDDDNA